MATRRLNKKVALIGSAVLIIALVAAIWVVLGISRDPTKFIEDGDAAARAQDYKGASVSYREAFKRARDPELKQQVLHKLIDVSIAAGDWKMVLGYWREAITANVNDARARYGRLKYLYIVADGGNYRIWQQVHKDATEFLEVARGQDLLKEPTAQWDVFTGRWKDPEGQLLGTYLHMAKGRAALEMVVRGAVPDEDEALAEAEAELEEAKRYDADNVEVYRYLAGVAVERGKVKASRGSFEERDKAAQEALAILQQAVEVAGENPRAHTGLLALKLAFAKRSAPAREEVAALEKEFQALAERFPDSAEAYRALAEYYADLSFYTPGQEGLGLLEKAVAAAEKAVALEPEVVAHRIVAFGLHYRRFTIYGWGESLDTAIKLAKEALRLPGAQDREGPWSFVNKTNRFRIYSFLAQSCLMEVLEPSGVVSGRSREQWLADAEEAVHNIEQIFETGQEPQVVKWRGILELAKGNRASAVKKLYAAYEQIKAVKPSGSQWGRDSQFAYLSWLLARIFKDSRQSGAVAEFLTSALRSGITDAVPEARLDYVEAILKFNLWSDAIENIDMFEARLGPNARSEELRIKTYIGAGEFAKASELIAKRPESQAETVKLKLALVQAQIKSVETSIARQENRDTLGAIVAAGRPEEGVDSSGDLAFMRNELAEYRQQELKLIESLLELEPSAVSYNTIFGNCGYNVRAGRLAEALALVDRLLAAVPGDTDAAVYKLLLAEPDPLRVPVDRRNELAEQVFKSVKDAVERSLHLGMLYRSAGRMEEAVAEFRKVLDDPSSKKQEQKTWYYRAEEERMPRRLAADHLFDIALDTEDWSLAEEVIGLAKVEDFDGCGGKVYQARLAYAKKEYAEAAARVEECLKERPVFSRMYALKSNIQNAQGDIDGAIESIRRAMSLNPLDATVAKEMARLLYSRNLKAGTNLAPEQANEARNALQRAISLSPGDLQLRRFYADFIAEDEPLKAVAILQALQRVSPSFENSVRLGHLATQVARDERDPAKKEALFSVAGAALEEARKLKPNDDLVLHRYAEYLRAKGEDSKVPTILADANKPELLWYHYFQRGQYSEAEEVLKQLLAREPNNTDVIKGLLLVTEKTSDAEGVQRYSELLLRYDPSVDNHLIQIQSFLRVGLVREAGMKLQSFTEKYPDEPRTMLLRAWLSMRKGQLDDALALTNRYLEGNPDNAPGWRLKGEICFHAGDMTSAVKALKRSKALKDDPITRVVLAKAYLRTERPEAAITELKMAIDSPRAPLEARTLLEDTYKRLGRTDALRKLYEETIHEFPNSVYWLNRAGSFALEQQQYDLAESLFARSFQLKREAYGASGAKELRYDGLHASAFDGYMRALILRAGVPNTSTWNPRKLDEVFQHAREYIETDYAPLAYLRMAQAQLLLGHKKTAIEYCRTAVEKAEGNERLAEEVLLRMYLMLGPKEVMSYCTERLASEPGSLAAHFTLFNLYKISRDYEKAIYHIDQCIQLAGEDNPRRVDYTAKKAEILTLAYQKTSDNKYLRLAIADYESLLAKMPNNISVLNNLAYMLTDTGERLEEALEYAETAYNAMPNDPEILDTYGYVLHKNGKNREAVEQLSAAVQQYEQKDVAKPPEVFEHLGMAKEALGDKAGALDAYKQALDTGSGRMTEMVRNRINKAIARLSG